MLPAVRRLPEHLSDKRVAYLVSVCIPPNVVVLVVLSPSVADEPCAELPILPASGSGVVALPFPLDVAEVEADDGRRADAEVEMRSSSSSSGAISYTE